MKLLSINYDFNNRLLYNHFLPLKYFNTKVNKKASTSKINNP